VRDHDTLPGPKQVVLCIAGSGEPDAPADHHQFPVQRVDPKGLPPGHLEGPAMNQLELRIHHQSPVHRVTSFVDNRREIQ
jgi:hypothetical protein